MNSKNKYSLLQSILLALFTGVYITSNVIAGKMLQINWPFTAVMTSAIVVFPITYILSDLFSEVYGYKFSRIACYTAFGCMLVAVGVFKICLEVPHPEWWNAKSAFETVLGSTFRATAVSLIGFVVGNFVNDRIFRFIKLRRMRKLSGSEISSRDDTFETASKIKGSHGGFAFRAITSSIVGQTVDSCIFSFGLFLGVMSVKDIAVGIAVYVTFKVLYELVTIPFTCWLVKKVATVEAD